jgi:uncharacterized protein YjbI with pentapeptide repeats
VDLRGAVLREANLTNVRITDNLGSGSNLQGADLTGTLLTHLVYDRKTRWPKGFNPGEHGAHAIEPKADFRGWDLDDAPLAVAELTQANLQGASLRNASLFGSMLRLASLRGANLQGADLRDADLRGADLTIIKLSGARYNGHTCWPRGFHPKRHGAVLVR